MNNDKPLFSHFNILGYQDKFCRASCALLVLSMTAVYRPDVIAKNIEKGIMHGLISRFSIVKE